MRCSIKHFAGLKMAATEREERNQPLMGSPLCDHCSEGGGVEETEEIQPISV